MDLHSPLILASAPAGLAVGAAAWLLVGGGALASAGIAPLEAHLTGASPLGETAHPLPADLIGDALSTPLFALTTGPGAVSEVALRLDGLARTPHHIAALISIAGKPPQWIELGQTSDDVTLQEVQPSSVVVDTATGFKTVNLGETVGGAPVGPTSPATGGAPPQMAQPTPAMTQPTLANAPPRRMPPVGGSPNAPGG